MPDQIQSSARGIDLSGRIVASSTIIGSPAGAAETVVGQVTIPSGLTLAFGVILMGWMAYAIGATGASAQVRLRRTNVAGATVADSGAQTGGHNTPAQLVADDINGLDLTQPTAGTWVMTLQIAAATGASAVSQAWLLAIAV